MLPLHIYSISIQIICLFWKQTREEETKSVQKQNDSDG